MFLRILQDVEEHIYGSTYDYITINYKKQDISRVLYNHFNEICVKKEITKDIPFGSLANVIPYVCFHIKVEKEITKYYFSTWSNMIIPHDCNIEIDIYTKFSKINTKLGMIKPKLQVKFWHKKENIYVCNYFYPTLT